MADGKSFARDVTTPISIPEVQAPDFSSNRTTAQDIAGIATFGFALHDRSVAQKAEKLRKQQIGEMDTKADALMSKWLNISAQHGERAANRQLQKDILDFGDPSQSSMLSTLTAKRIAQTQTGIPAGGTSSKKDTFLSNTSDEVIQRSLIAIGAPIGTDLNNTTPEILAAVELQAREFERLQIQVEVNKEAAQENTERGRANLNALASSAGKLLQSDLAPIVDSLFQNFRKLSEVPNPVEQKALIDQIQQSQTTVKDSFQRAVDSMFVDVPPSTEKEKAINDLTRQLDNVFKLYTDPNFDIAQRNASNLDFLVKNLKLDLFNAGNIMIRLKETYGQTIPELTFSNLAAQGGGSISEKVERAVEDVFFGQNEQQRTAFKLDKYMSYVSGIDKIEDAGDLLPREEQESLYKDAFKFFNDMSITGEILVQDKDTTEKLLGGITFLLEDGNKEKTSQALKIIDYLEHPNTQAAINKASPERKEAIDNMAITYSKTLLTNPVDGVIPRLNSLSTTMPIEFDAQKGEFTLKSTIPTQVSSASGLTSISSQIQREKFREARTAVKQANKALQVFKNSRDANPTLSNFTEQEAMSWLLKQSSGVQLGDSITIKGVLPDLPAETEAAIQRRVTVEQEQKRIAEIKEKGTLGEQIKGQAGELDKLSRLLKDVASGKIDLEALREALNADTK